MDGLDPGVIQDPGGPRPSSWRTHQACLQSVPDDATHFLVLQDDAWPCADFSTRVHTAIQEQPDRILCLFVSAMYQGRFMWQAKERGDRFLELRIRAYVPLVGVVYPADIAREILSHSVDKRTGPNRADDAVVANYVRWKRCGALATVPCLVDHRDDVPSVFPQMHKWHGKRRPHRVAALFTDQPDAV